MFDRLTNGLKAVYARSVMGQEKWVESMRELLSSSHPGVVTKEDLAQVESRLDELLGMMDQIEEKLGISYETAQEPIEASDGA